MTHGRTSPHDTQKRTHLWPERPTAFPRSLFRRPATSAGHLRGHHYTTAHHFGRPETRYRNDGLSGFHGPHCLGHRHLRAMPPLRLHRYGAALHTRYQLLVHRSHHRCGYHGRTGTDLRIVHGGRFGRNDYQPSAEIYAQDYHPARVGHRSDPHRHEPHQGGHHGLRWRCGSPSRRDIRQPALRGAGSPGTGTYPDLQPQQQPVSAHEFHRHRPGYGLCRGVADGHD